MFSSDCIGHQHEQTHAHTRKWDDKDELIISLVLQEPVRQSVAIQETFNASKPAWTFDKKAGLDLQKAIIKIDEILYKKAN